jgi:hypothetical protein
MNTKLTAAVISLLLAASQHHHVVQAKQNIRATRASAASMVDSSLKGESFRIFELEWGERDFLSLSMSMSTSDGLCDGGIIGNGICANGECCSPFGWCGTGPDYCVETTTPPTPVETVVPVNSGFSLVLTNDYDMDPSILASISNTFFSYYPHIVNVYSPNATKSLTIHISSDCDWGVPGWTSWHEVTLGGPCVEQWLGASGMVVHEITHVAQSTWQNVPGHFIEGFADFVRDETGVDVGGDGWMIPQGYEGGHYTDGYGTTAAFVKWMLANNLFVLQDLITAFQDGSYSDEYTWPALTGKSLDDLWGLYSGV